ncbi:hypothetical protein [Thetidibacter halocola]|uniref:Uncharacterized protein n=1 Tax=Thetidibacter halocola TaxID=2827239 RepID=A0A8J7WB79_9RHOB|nr:hypothetical protein [Thetidibacter halocola]MBS0123552.1 hypothetical protein [Thetidibacter halocola]
MIKLVSTAIAATGLSVLAGFALFSGHGAIAHGALLPDQPFVSSSALAPAALVQADVVTPTPAVSLAGLVAPVTVAGQSHAPSTSPRPEQRPILVAEATDLFDEQRTEFSIERLFGEPGRNAGTEGGSNVTTPRIVRATQPATPDNQQAARKKLFLPYMIGIAR